MFWNRRVSINSETEKKTEKMYRVPIIPALNRAPDPFRTLRIILVLNAPGRAEYAGKLLKLRSSLGMIEFTLCRSVSVKWLREIPV